MSTPASQALSEAGATGAAAGSTGTANGTAGAAQPTQFWSGWTDPALKDTRDWVANKNYSDVQTLAKSARDWETQATTLRAGKGYPVPGPDGKIDPNADKAWRTLTGVPETPDKYDLPIPENNPYPQFKGFMAEELHKAGVPAAMAPALARGYEAAVAKMEAQIREQEDTQSKAALEELKVNWGANYQERVALAARGKDWLAKEAGGLNDQQLRVMESMLGTSKFLTAMWKLGAGNGEARFAGGDQSNRFGGGASEAQARMDQITADRSAGKISDMQWRDMAKPGGEIEQLRDRIVAGFSTQQ